MITDQIRYFSFSIILWWCWCAGSQSWTENWKRELENKITPVSRHRRASKVMMRIDFKKIYSAKQFFVFNSTSFRDIRVVHSRSRPPKPPKPPKKHAEEARSQKFDQLDRLNAPLRPGPPYDDQVGQGSICKCQKYWFCNLVFVSFSIIPPCDNHRKTKNNFFVQFPKSFFSVL